MKCKDCGTLDYQPSQGRWDVCQPCMDLRMELIKAMNEKRVPMDEFRELQRALGRGDGRGANAIRRTLGLSGPEI